jgi:glutathionylspermidine synthase
MATKFSLKEIEKKIQKATREQQRLFLKRLPRILKIEKEDWHWLKIIEPSFDFWDNSYDERYNNL